MADVSLNDSVIKNLVAALQAINEGDSYSYQSVDDSTYNYTPAKVTDESVDYTQLNTYPVYEIIDGPETVQYFGKRAVNYFTVFIRCYHYMNKGFGTATAKRRAMVQDVRGAILQDLSRGGYASNTEIINIESDEGLIEPVISAQLTLRITILTLDMNR